MVAWFLGFIGEAVVVVAISVCVCIAIVKYLEVVGGGQALIRFSRLLFITEEFRI